MKPAALVLEDGRRFFGRNVGAEGTTFGEVVFNTGMAGYQETLTDPSYRGQIVVMTASHIGNYGLNDEDVESEGIQVSGFAARHFPDRFSSVRGKRTIAEGLGASGIVGIDGIDTRALVRHLRTRGVMRGGISTEAVSDAAADALVEEIRRQPTMAGAALALTVGTKERYEWTRGLPAGASGKRIAAIDYGIKWNILRMLAGRGLKPSVFPATATAEELLSDGFDGFFLSNGPGDPEALPTCVETVKALVASGKPVFGICLGHQLLGLALGGTTFKLKFGHRGANHPVKNLLDGTVAITSQNHGFAVATDSLPPHVEPTHVNLNDGTCEGFRVKGAPVFAVQYHPESAPGPHDSAALFDEFVRLL
ncbi:MAG: glutamine-hydrolyzing carbamoyl-phosphate synthase small subunit [Thermoanaerobaculia bacterium]